MRVISILLNANIPEEISSGKKNDIVFMGRIFPEDRCNFIVDGSNRIAFLAFAPCLLLLYLGLSKSG